MRRCLVVACALVTVACAAESVSSPTSTTTPDAAPATEVADTTTPSTVVTTTSAPATTTTVAPDREQISPRAMGPLPLRPGVTYVHDFALPWAVTFDRDGWLLDFAGDRYVAFLNEVGDRSVSVSVTVLPFKTTDDLLTFVLDHPKSIEVTTPATTSLGGFDAVTVDVLVPEDTGPTDPDNQCWAPNAGPVLYEQLGVDGRLYPSVLVGCAWNRVWIADVDGISVVVHGADIGGQPDEPASLEPILPVIDEFLAAIDLDP